MLKLVKERISQRPLRLELFASGGDDSDPTARDLVRSTRTVFAFTRAESSLSSGLSNIIPNLVTFFGKFCRFSGRREPSSSFDGGRSSFLFVDGCKLFEERDGLAP